MIPTLWCVASVPVATGYVYVNDAYKYSGSSSVASFALPANSLTTGNNIFVFVSYYDTTTTVSLSDTAGNTYTGLTQIGPSGGCIGRWFYCFNATGNASNIVTVSFSSSRPYGWGSSIQFSKAGAAFDVETSGAVNPHASVTSESFSTTAAGLILAGENSYNAQNSASFNNSLISYAPAQGGDATLYYQATGYRITSGALSSQTVTETGSSTPNRIIVIAAFK